MQTYPWPKHVDRFLFSKGGEATFRKHSAEYDDFRQFYTKYSALVPNKHKMAQSDELQLASKALLLFEQYKVKRLAALSTKITRDRNSLPIAPFEARIVELVRNNSVILIAADTGAGKSTQVPQYLMKAGFEKIACTQPRRIACYSLAKRVNYESMDMYGSEVAYKVRFDTTSTAKTKILFLTEGLLLKQFANDPYLRAYDVIIVDEVHERHVSGDYLLAVLKKLLVYRKDIRIVLMSATINAALFGKYFKAPIIEIPGRMYPVRIEYLPIAEPDANLVDEKLIRFRESLESRESVASKTVKLDAAPYLRILERIDQTIPADERGDLLIFVPGMNEIGILCEELQNHASCTKRWIILSLHSTLSVQEQEKVFDVAPPGVRKCILSTNIAETSVTIDGIRFIIDSGKVKELGFDTVGSFSRLSEFWISKSSAKQRAGRAGRTGPGECYRFYSLKEYEGFNDFPVPEICRVSLEAVLLQISAFGFGDPRNFDFLERPPDRNIIHSMKRLSDLGCYDSSNGLDPEVINDMGRILANLPIDAILGKMLVLGSVSDLMSPILSIAAALSVQSPFARVSEAQHTVLENRRLLHSSHGDPFTLMNMLTEWLQIKSDHPSQSRAWCKRRGIEEQRLYEIVKLKHQFGQTIRASIDTEEFSAEVEVHEEDVSFCVIQETERRRIRDTRILLEKRKRESHTNSRKVLKMAEYQGDFPDDGGDQIYEASVQELEFSLKNNARVLKDQTDVSVLQSRDLNIIKLIIASGLYPNFAISDESNYSRPISDHVYHSKSRRFLFIPSSSVFAFNPELIEAKVISAPKSDEKNEKDTLDNLHGKVQCQELLCYVSLLETTKPFLINSTRIGALPAVLLFAHSVIISHDLIHLVIDDWLHLEFGSAEVSESVLSLAVWLRYAWKIVIDGKLKNFSDSESTNQKDEDFAENLIIGTHIGELAFEDRLHENDKKARLEFMSRDLPSVIKMMREKWIQLSESGCIDSEALTTDGVMDGLVKIVDIEVPYSIDRLKMQQVESIFGYNIFAPENSRYSVQVTPNFTYFAKEIQSTTDIQTSALPKIIPFKVTKKPADLILKRPEVIEQVKRSLYICPLCKESLNVSTAEIFKHRKECQNTSNIS